MDSSHPPSPLKLRWPASWRSLPWRAHLSRWGNALAVLATSAGTTGVLLACAHWGWLEPFETAAWDAMVRLRPAGSPDDRLLVVEITESDLKQYEWPLSDRTLARLFERLQRHNPDAIGLDIYRDLPQGSGREALVRQLRAPNVVAIANIGSAASLETLSTPPPPTVPPHRVGFNDLILDKDNIVRRAFLFATLEDGSLSAFSLQIAELYLGQRGIEADASPFDPNIMQLGASAIVPLEPHSGGYANHDTRGYQLMLDYRSDGDRIHRVSLQDVLEGAVPPEWIEDKIVLIGSSAPSLKDLFATPYSAAATENFKMPGVLVHGQIVSQLVGAALGDRPLFSFWSYRGEVLWIFLWTAAGACLGWRVSHPIPLAAGAIAIAIAIGAASFALFYHYFWVPTAAPILGAIAAGSIVMAYQAYQAQRQQTIVMKLLGQNTSPEIADALWDRRAELLQSGKLQGQKLTATMLFTDIKDFSTLSEQIPPERLMEWLNEYLSALTQEVQAHQGIVNKFTGDGLMAVFGVPVARTSRESIALDACNAAACGLAFGRRLETLNRGWQQRGLPVVQMRVGIFTGIVVAGSLGGKERLEYGVIGDSVNTASRLESCEKDRQPSICRVLVARETLDLLGDRFIVESWGPISLKGKQQVVDVYRVVKARPAAETASGAA